MNYDNYLSNSFSTGSGGENFENRIQASFVVLLLVKGSAPVLPAWPIKKLKLQGSYKGYNTDDLIVYVEQESSGREAKLLCQIKHFVSITKSNRQFRDVIHAAWDDFNNKEIFIQGKDAIALITGPLSERDTKDFRNLLKQARFSENEEDFFNRMELENFTSTIQREKLEIIKKFLCSANQDEMPLKKEIWGFLSSFHLLIYDMDIQGVTFSLLHSLINQSSTQAPDNIFAKIMEIVTWENENAGLITRNTLPPSLLSEFEIPTVKKKDDIMEITDDYIERIPENQHLNIILANLIGSWEENNDIDKKLVSNLTGQEYLKWTTELKTLLLKTNVPLQQNNGIWNITDRVNILKVFGFYISDDHLVVFKEHTTHILSEIDPKLELPKEDRFAAKLYGKSLKYSNSLRDGIASTLALIGNNASFLEGCSISTRDNLTSLIVRQVFQDPNWKTWASLNQLLPLLSEAAPDEFLNQIDSTFSVSKSVFEKLFAEEGQNVIGGENYITGILWALETLAWESKYLVRVSVLLAKLASIDPGGKWANRPINSLITIFLPWYPQTLARKEKKRAAIEKVIDEEPTVGWELLIHLLPNKNKTSLGSRKPRYRNPTENYDRHNRVSQKEYLSQINLYGKRLLELAKRDSGKFVELIGELDCLPYDVFREFLQYLQSPHMIKSSQSRKAKIRDELVKQQFVFQSRSDDDYNLLYDAFHTLEPENPLFKYKYLFASDKYKLMDLDKNLDEEQSRLIGEQENAIKIIFENKGLKSVFDFLEIVESTSDVGLALASLSVESIDKEVLSKCLNADKDFLQPFIEQYTWNRYVKQGWTWVDALDKFCWTSKELIQFFSFLPFKRETWRRVENALESLEYKYWKVVPVYPYREEDHNLNYAIDKLLENDRPIASIYCLFSIVNRKGSINTGKALRSLYKALASNEPVKDINKYHIVKIIGYLQKNSDTNREELLITEWAYLNIIKDYRGTPKTLESELALNPNFFCEMIRLIYKSKKSDENEEITDKKQNRAAHAMSLLDQWSTPPGTIGTDSFSEENLNKWLSIVKNQCDESGHLDIALQHVGKILTFAPKDSSGLWIHSAVAQVLNAKDAEHIRKGFVVQIKNSRGAYFVDPSGKPERDLANKYNKIADEIENGGYFRFAISLREIAKSYDQDAERNIIEHKQEQQRDLK